MRRFTLMLILMAGFAWSVEAQQVVSGINDIAFDASDNVELSGQVQVFFEGQLACASAPIPGGSTAFADACVWDTSTLPNGLGNLTATVSDTSANEGTSASFPVDIQNVDNEPPTVEILSVTPQ